MKKILSLIGLAFTWLTVAAQNVNPYFLYTENGLEDIFYPSDTRAISLKPLADTDPLQYELLFKLNKNGVRIPVSRIDSISFVTPPLSDFCQQGKVNHVNYDAFRQLVVDCAEKPENQVFLGERPVIVDCWAKWCGYCIEMMPTMEQLAQEYKGRVDFYKVDVDEEPLLSKFMDSRSLPCLYFFPRKGHPMSHEGVMDAASIREVIESFLLVTDDENPDAEKPAVSLNLWKGDQYHTWTDRRFTAQIKCTSANATLVKYGCFLKEDIVNSPLTEKELIQRYGNVLAEEYLPQVNSEEGMPVTFKAEKNSTYLFLCLVKNAKGGVTVESAEITTDATYTPLMDFQVSVGALAEYIQPQKNHMTVYLKTMDAVEARYGYLLKSEFNQAMSEGKTIETLLEAEGDNVFHLDADQLASANALGYNKVIAPLQEMTDYTCFAWVRNAKGETMIDSEELTTPYAGYYEVISYPDVNLITSLIGSAVSCSVNCVSGNAVYSSLLMLPSDEVTRYLAEGQTLEELMKTHPKVSVMSAQQLEWVNGQGVSNVITDVQPATRYTCIADVIGRFGGRQVKRSDIQTLPQGETVAPVDVVLAGSYSSKMLTASAVCRSANAASATSALIESSKLEKLLSSGLSLEDVMAERRSDFLQYDSFTADQVTWFNQSGFVLAYNSPLPSTRYTWLLDTRSTTGERLVQRTETLTPNAYEIELMPYALSARTRGTTLKLLPLQQISSVR